MASLLKASNEIHDKQLSKRAKGKGKAEDGADTPAKMRKDKVLMLCSRGVTQRHRHLMHDLEVLLPHTKKGESCALVSPRYRVFRIGLCSAGRPR